MTFKEELQQLKLHAQGMRVLYVEDEPLMRENIKLLLETIFSDVMVAKHGKEGLDYFHEGDFDIVISDILMPELNGVGMIKAMKALKPKQHFVVTSACEEGNYLLDLINLGVSYFLLKPIKTEQMVSVLHEVVQNIFNDAQVAQLTEKLKQELLHQSTLLEQYKEVVDLSMMVVKMDLHGDITYANALFLETSGYAHEDVIATKHHQLYHSEERDAFDARIWSQILSKQIWRGTIKNIKKDGTHFITETTIKPILDEHGEIMEFISTSYDVTPLFDLNDEIWQTQHEMLSLLGEVGETRSHETGNHVKRVAKYSELLGRLYGLGEEEIRLLYSAAPMHDIGKIGISDAILLKPGRLDLTEYEIMKTHSTIGYDILKNSNRPLLKAAAVIALEHHERWDGTGYPKGLQEEDIHIYGRIVALADVFDALSCERVYKKAWPMEEIISFITQERAKQFDPQLVDMFMANIDAFKSIATEYGD